MTAIEIIEDKLDIKAVQAQAQKELQEEEFREAVEKYKTKLRTKRSVWDTMFPWKIMIIKKERP